MPLTNRFSKFLRLYASYINKHDEEIRCTPESPFVHSNYSKQTYKVDYYNFPSDTRRYHSPIQLPSIFRADQGHTYLKMKCFYKASGSFYNFKLLYFSGMGDSPGFLSFNKISAQQGFILYDYEEGYTKNTGQCRDKQTGTLFLVATSTFRGAGKDFCKYYGDAYPVWW